MICVAFNMWTEPLDAFSIQQLCRGFFIYDTFCENKLVILEGVPYFLYMKIVRSVNKALLSLVSFGFFV